MRVVAARYDAVRGNPWSKAYGEMDQWFPGSRFVLTIRDENTWFDSFVRHNQRVRAIDYSPDRDEWVKRYRLHNKDVQEYFADTDQLLIFDAEGGDGWEELCSFLGHPQPDVPYPHIASPRA